ncbi:MAG: hypothetical protein LBE57_01215 [Methanosarcinales archaeon]|jgi:5'(3')-deoxyribonucleotidase|nr:hypothetical protein [Methanosarcinales archaeon]
MRKRKRGGKMTAEKKERKILYIDMDGVLADYQRVIDELDEETYQKYCAKPEENKPATFDEIPDAFKILPPIKDAVESFLELSKHFDIYILSTAPWENNSAWADKLYWVKKHLGECAHKRLILTHYKNLNKGDFLVDDRDKNGAGEFEGELIRFGSSEFPNWVAVKAYLMERK